MALWERPAILSMLSEARTMGIFLPLLAELTWTVDVGEARGGGHFLGGRGRGLMARLREDDELQSSSGTEGRLLKEPARPPSNLSHRL